MIVSKLPLNGDKLNLLAAYPALTPIIAQSWPTNQTIESACVLKDPRVEIAYLNGCVPRFHSARYSNSKFCDLFVPQPKVLGVHHDTLTLSGFKEINEHHIILLEALEWTKTSISKLIIESNNFEVAEYFVMHLKTPSIKISNEPYDCIDYKTLQLSELVEKYPKLFECEELDIHGEIVGNVNDLVKNFSKFTPIIKFGRMDSYYNSAFVTVFDVASFLKKLKDGVKWEENNEGIDSLDRLKRWAFHIYYDAYSAKNSARKRRKYDEDMLHKFMMIDDSNVTSNRRAVLRKKNEESLSSSISDSYWKMLPTEMQIEIISKLQHNSCRLNLLVAYPGLLSHVLQTWRFSSENLSKCVLADPQIELEYDACKKIFYSVGYAQGRYCELKTPDPKLFGEQIPSLNIIGCQDFDQTHAGLLKAFTQTNTTVKKLSMESSGYNIVHEYVKELKPRNIYINLYSELEDEDDIVNNMSLAKLWNAYPHILDCDKLVVDGPITSDYDSLLKIFVHFPAKMVLGQSTGIFDRSFIAVAEMDRFLKYLTSKNWEVNSLEMVALERMTNWIFHLNCNKTGGEYEPPSKKRKCDKCNGHLLHQKLGVNEDDVKLLHKYNTCQLLSYPLKITSGDKVIHITAYEEFSQNNCHRVIQLTSSTTRRIDSDGASSISNGSCRCVPPLDSDSDSEDLSSSSSDDGLTDDDDDGDASDTADSEEDEFDDYGEISFSEGEDE
ncbi:hypothetical protein WR25_10975 [Diploscapter pachys]|uniref:Uncharacterized protein n=1 Tax=Diploscapter pachys TaxID=2018661 RepID=A0A2A2LY43_9BILA|nr:hypothetical protein WR25_10975 [Diploscapter pachys]